MSRLIVLYGINNLGKSTQLPLLEQALAEAGEQVKSLKYPNYTNRTGDLLNTVIRAKEQTISPTELQLWQTVNKYEDLTEQQELRRSGTTLLLENYWGTTLAVGLTQGVPRSVLNSMIAGLPDPDLSILLHGKRFLEGREETHVFEQDHQALEVMQRHFLKLADEFGWHKVNANQSVEAVHRAIRQVVDRHWSNR